MGATGRETWATAVALTRDEDQGDRGRSSVGLLGALLGEALFEAGAVDDEALVCAVADLLDPV